MIKKDKSRKGSIDKEILPLIDLVNSFPGYETTSSCAGRMIIIEKNKRKCDCRWIFCSHEQADFKAVLDSLKNIGNDPVWFKFEPFILHVKCSDIKMAEKIFISAGNAGLKHSGIISISKNIIIEFIGNEYIEAIIAKDGSIIVSKKYLKILVDEANSKLKINLERIDRFMGELSILAKAQITIC